MDALRGVGIRQIACGSGHTVVLTVDGEIHTWGRGDDGRLGHGDNGWKYVPRLTQSLAGQVVTQVTCGSYHTAAVTGNGDLWTWGGGMYGKLGHGNEAGCSTPKRVEGLVGLPVGLVRGLLRFRSGRLRSRLFLISDASTFSNFRLPVVADTRLL